MTVAEIFYALKAACRVDRHTAAHTLAAVLNTPAFRDLTNIGIPRHWPIERPSQSMIETCTWLNTSNANPPQNVPWATDREGQLTVPPRVVYTSRELKNGSIDLRRGNQSPP